MNEAVRLSYACQPIRPGEVYAGRPENIPEGCPLVLGEPVKLRPIDARGETGWRCVQRNLDAVFSRQSR
jgi:hypothetical protein